MASTKTPKETLERLRTMVRGLKGTGHIEIVIYLGPYHYEHLLIVKGLRHGLGVLTCWGPYRDQRPIKTFAGYPLVYVDSGGSRVEAMHPEKGKRVFGLG